MSSDLLWSLIAIQIMLGGFDTLFHHEFTERLAWRASQRHELQLHSVRNFIYALLFLILGFTEVHGAFALVVLGLLAIEIIITLMDFVEEDMSRKLPATERITHTLLAINYGAVLVIAIPVLIAWAQLPTAVVPTHHGWWSVMATFAACAVALFGLRDAIASQRCLRLAATPAAPLVAALSGRKTVLITGATGFIGQRLSAGLVEAGHDVVVLVRNPLASQLPMRPLRIVTSLDQIPADARIDAIVNLAGEPIANFWWTEAKRKSVIASRVGTTQAVAALVARLTTKPQALVNGSAIGWYGLHEDNELTEGSDGTACFSRDLCTAWEAEASKIAAQGVRTVMVRIGLVVGTESGFLTRMLTPFEFGLGGRFGSGKQWMSWITRDDVVRLIAHAIATPSLSGPLNATAPEPVRNADFAAALAKALRRPAIFHVPAAMLSLIGGDMARELLLGGQKVLPAKALASGFRFQHATLPEAFGEVLGEAQDFAVATATAKLEQQTIP